MESLSVQLIVKALDCLTARAAVTAENIANAGTQGYRPLRLSFEQALADAARQGRDAIAAVEPHIERTMGGELRLDLELATASSTSLRHAALIEVLNRQLQIDALGVSKGN